MKMQQLRSWLAFIIGAVVLGCLIGLAARVSFFDVYAQSDKKIVTLAPTLKSPLKISDLKIAGRSQKLDEEFNAEINWVKNLSFKLESVSKKPITFVQINVNFPETRATGSMMSYGFSFGELPGRKISGNRAMLLNPSETLDISLDKEMEKLSKFMNSRQPIESIQKVELEIGYIGFDDNTVWRTGELYQRDPNDSNKLKRIENETPQ